jgi:nitrogen fixation NifU-like protein
MYSEKVMDHFRNPRNMGEIPDADGLGTVGNPVCGDMMNIYIKVEDNRIVDIKFKTFGCGAAIATSSMVTELAKGKTLDEAMKLTRSDVADSLNGLPTVKMHCSNLAADGLHEAIKDYRKKREAKK